MLFIPLFFYSSSPLLHLAGSFFYCLLFFSSGLGWLGVSVYFCGMEGVYTWRSSGSFFSVVLVFCFLPLGVMVGFGPTVLAPAPRVLRGELGGPAVPGCILLAPQFPHGKSLGLA